MNRLHATDTGHVRLELIALLLAIVPWARLAAAGPAAPVDQGPGLASAPLAFVENQGQWDDPAKFVARRGPMVARLEKDAIALQLRQRGRGGPGRGVLVRLSFEDANESVALVGEDRQRARHNYFVGRDRSGWRCDVPSYASVLYRGLYDGLDLRVRDQSGRLEYDLLIAPGADVGRAVISCDGIAALKIGADGSLVMQTALGPITQKPPTTWQVLASGERVPVECSYCLVSDRSYGFEVPDRQADAALVIDPGLEWASYLGASGDDWIMKVAVDDSGVVTVAGFTSPLTDAGPPFPIVGAYDTDPDEDFDEPFVARFSADGSTLLWCTFLGGDLGIDRIFDMAVDGSGVVTVTGHTFASDFPTTQGAYDETFNGESDAFIARLDPNLQGDAQLVWCTFLGGSDWDGGTSLDMDASGVVTVAGHTASSVDFPTTEGAYDRSYNGGEVDDFVARLNPSLQDDAQLVWSTYLGGSGSEGCPGCTNDFEIDLQDLALHSSGEVYVSGLTWSSDFPTVDGYDMSHNGMSDARVSHLSADGSALIWSTFLGGSEREGAIAVAVDESGVVTAGGFTVSSNFPTTSGAIDPDCSNLCLCNDGFVVRLDPSLGGADQLIYSTCLGGPEDSEPVVDLVLHETGVVTLTGWAGPGLPTTPNAYQENLIGMADAFVIRMSLDPESADNLLYSTYLGASDGDWALALGTNGPDDVLIGGMTFSPDLATDGAYDTTYDDGPPEWPDDGFVARLDLCPIDIDDDGDVGVTDFLALLARWGPCPPGPCPADLDDDGIVGITDFLTLLANWGLTCP